jgi:hypothetical protein
LDFFEGLGRLCVEVADEAGALFQEILGVHSGAGPMGIFAGESSLKLRSSAS